MAAVILDGNKIAERIREFLKAEIDTLKGRFGRSPMLVSIQVGENPATAAYLKGQQKVASLLGIELKIQILQESTSQSELIALLENLNKDNSVTGILLQLPVPKHINAKEAVRFIDPKKDAEGMHPENISQCIFGDVRIGPCTALAVMELINASGIDLYGKEAVVVGHSEIVGKPVSLLLLNKFVTVTTCHIATGQRGVLPEHVKRAEILVVAVGKPGLIKGEWIKEGAVVIDVGINRVGDKIVGDVEFEKAVDVAGYITPVPGGVGPLTVTMLMRNLVEAFKLQKGI